MKLRIYELTLPVLLAATLIAACSRNKNPNEISESGTIEAIDVNISSKVSGIVLKRYVDEGSQVKEGDSVAEVDPTIYDLQLKQAQATVQMAKDNLAVISENYWSTLKLFKQGVAQEKQKEDAEARYKVANSQLDAAQSMESLAEQMLSYCHITSPVKGIVTHKLVEAGELAGPGTAVVTVSELDKMKLVIYVTEPELGLVKVGQAADVRIDTYPDRSVPGTVIYVSPVAEFTPKNIQTKEERVKLVFAVKIQINNPEGILKAGMPADATIKTDSVAK